MSCPLAGLITGYVFPCPSNIHSPPIQALLFKSCDLANVGTPLDKKSSVFLAAIFLQCQPHPQLQLALPISESVLIFAVMDEGRYIHT